MWVVTIRTRQITISYISQTYSNGYSEVILGRVIKKLNLPRDEIVVMTKVVHVFNILQLSHHIGLEQVFNVVGREYNTHQLGGRKDPDQNGYVNQHGLSRKACFQSIMRSIDFLNLRNSTSSQAWKRVWSGFKWIISTFYNACLIINMLNSFLECLSTYRPQIRQWNTDRRDGDAYSMLAFAR